MVRGRDGAVGVPSYTEVLRAPVFLRVFLAATLSTWGDYIARITIAAVVFSWTGSALATAATFAVSLVPSILGRALLSPLCDRWPARFVMVGTHLLRALLVVGLIIAVSTTESLVLVLSIVFLLEFVGGPAITAGQVLLTDIFPDRRLYARAFSLSTLATQINQAIGLALGGVIVGAIGDTQALLLDLVTFLLGALLLLSITPPKSLVVDPSETDVHSLLGDLGHGWRQIRSSRVLTMLLLLSLASALAIAAPEAVALPYGAQDGRSSSWGGLLMAAPILGAVVGVLLIARLPAERQFRLVMRLALLMPLPLLVTVFGPPLPVVWAAWFLSGALQCYMLPLQSAFTLMVPPAMRGRVFGIAGALSVGVTGVCFLAAGWISEHTSPAASVGICAVLTLGALVLLAARWPRDEVARSIAATFRQDAEQDAEQPAEQDADDHTGDDTDAGRRGAGPRGAARAFPRPPGGAPDSGVGPDVPTDPLVPRKAGGG